MMKSELRKIYRERRSALAPGDAAKLSGQIANKFFDSFDLSFVRTLHCFVSIAKFNEIDTSLILDKLRTDFPAIRIAIPRIDPEAGEIESVLFSAQSRLVKNKWGIPEPHAGVALKASEIDLVLVPLLCFDIDGHRIGYGGGFYDKFLSRCRPDCRKFGISFFPPVESIADVDEHDIRLDACVTPEQSYFFCLNRHDLLGL